MSTSHPPHHPPPILLALSGPTSSGKTTLAAALAALLSPSKIIHADDFYKTDTAIPRSPRPPHHHPDWDCPASLDLVRLEAAIRDARVGGDVPPPPDPSDGVQQGDAALLTPPGQSASVTRLRAALRGRGLVIVEGFLLYSRGMPAFLRSEAAFDIRVLIRVRKEDAARRRAARNGYVTAEGFWTDPEGYFEEVVWPNYVDGYGGEGDGGVLLGGEGWRCWDGGMRVCVSGAGWGLERCLGWLVGVLGGEVERLDGVGGGG